MPSVNKSLNITCCFFIIKENESLFVFLKECESSFENIDILIDHFKFYIPLPVWNENMLRL